MSSGRRNRGTVLALAAVCLIVAAGGWLRLSNLDATNLTLEELNHYYVGRALAEGEGPVLPSGYRYERAIEYSALVELAGRYIESPETAVRLPSAVFGTVSLATLATGAWIMSGPGAAIITSYLIAIYPEAVIQSRTGRFYMLQFLLGIVALYGGWLLVGRPLRGSPLYDFIGGDDRREWRLRLLGGLAAGLALLLATAQQETSLLMAFALWVALALAGAYDLLRSGPSAWRRSLPLMIAAGSAVVGLAVLAARPSLVPALLLRATSTPYWARPQQDLHSFYYESLTAYFPGIFLLAAGAFVYLLDRQSRWGTYLLIMSAVPLALLSFALPFKADRFALLAIPPLFLAIGSAFGTLISTLRGAGPVTRRESESAFADHPRLRRFALVAGMMPVLITLPTTGMFWFGYDRLPAPDWKRAGELIAERADLRDLPLGATRSLVALFYWGRVDFSVTIGHLERWDEGAMNAIGRENSPGGAYVMSPEGTPDIYVGAPVVPSADGIRRAFAGHRAVVLGIDEPSIRVGMVDEKLLQTLHREAEEVCQGRCGSLELYVWPLNKVHPGHHEEDPLVLTRSTISP